jgi:ArsR family transcriptional regulator
MEQDYTDEIDFEQVLASGFDWIGPADVLKALGHPLRLQIVAILTSGEMHVSGLAEHLSERQATVSQHLSILRLHGLVDRTRANGYMMYRLAQPRLPELLRCVVKCHGTGDDASTSPRPQAYHDDHPRT